VKRYVSVRCYHKRSPEEARAQTEEGFAQEGGSGTKDKTIRNAGGKRRTAVK